MKTLRSSVKLAISAILIATVAVGQTGWERLISIAPGQTVRIQTANNRLEGTFVSASPDAVNFKLADGQQISISQPEVTQVEVRTQAHRGRNTLIGTAIGVGIGVASYASYGQILRNEGAKSTEAILIIPAVSGAGIGAILPTGRFKKIYEATPVK